MSGPFALGFRELMRGQGLLPPVATPYFFSRAALFFHSSVFGFIPECRSESSRIQVCRSSRGIIRAERIVVWRKNLVSD